MSEKRTLSEVLCKPVMPSVQKSLLYLDLDGTVTLGAAPVIDRDCADLFRELYKRLGRPDIVVHSGWGALINKDFMTKEGFLWMMEAAGMGRLNIVGFQPCLSGAAERRATISKDAERRGCERYIVLDDLYLGTWPNHILCQPLDEDACDRAVEAWNGSDSLSGSLSTEKDPSTGREGELDG